MWRSYASTKVLQTTQRVKGIRKKKFTTIILNLDDKAFVVHVVSIISLDRNVHPFYQAQMAPINTDKNSITILSEYTNFITVFSLGLVADLQDHTKINNYAIELIDGNHQLSNLIENLEPVELEILKAYRKINLANGFMRLSKFPVGILIFFILKLNNNLCLSVDYRGLNNLTIKNQYLLPLISESLDRLD